MAAKSSALPVLRHAPILDYNVVELISFIDEERCKRVAWFQLLLTCCQWKCFEFVGFVWRASRKIEPDLNFPPNHRRLCFMCEVGKM
mmetsp:Transcript_22062/g.37726  ORF Transcript_22062/g.37726 Transcript_22062/m.37726 type:complete len:87 (+) Transcript_22062:297-557(+)